MNLTTLGILICTQLVSLNGDIMQLKHIYLLIDSIPDIGTTQQSRSLIFPTEEHRSGNFSVNGAIAEAKRVMTIAVQINRRWLQFNRLLLQLYKAN